jgi:hypothetical protein
MIMTVYSYISDTTSSTQRTQVFALMEAMMTGIFLATPYFGGLIAKFGGLVMSFYLSLSFEFLAFLWLVFILVESLHTKSPNSNESSNSVSGQQQPTTIHGQFASLVSEKSAFEKVKTSLHESWTLFSSPSNRPLAFLVATLATIIFSAAGTQGFILLFVSFRFGWGLVEQGQFLLIISIIKMMYMMVVLPLALHRGYSYFVGSDTGLSETDKAERRFRYELGLMRIGIFLFAMGYPTLGLVKEGWMMPFSESLILYIFG